MKLKDFLSSNHTLLTEHLCIALVFICLCGALLSLIRPSKEQMMKKYDCTSLYAQLISTNLVRIPCTCGYCRPSEGIVVPEHLNQIGYDLKVEISTSYYPVVSLPTH